MTPKPSSTALRTLPPRRSKRPLRRFHSSCQTVIHLSPSSHPPSTLSLSSHPTPPSLLLLLLRLIVSITRVCLREHPALFRPHEEQNNAHNLLEGGVGVGCGAHASLGDSRGGNLRRQHGMNHTATWRDVAERGLSHLSSVRCRSDSKKRRLFPSEDRRARQPSRSKCKSK